MGKGAKDPPETGHSTMRHLCSLCAMGEVSPTTKVGTHWVKRRECTANRRSVSASNDLDDVSSSAMKTFSNKKCKHCEFRSASDTKFGAKFEAKENGNSMRNEIFASAMRLEAGAIFENKRQDRKCECDAKLDGKHLRPQCNPKRERFSKLSVICQ